MEEEVAKLIKNGPEWVPAMQNGRKVNAYRKQSVTFIVKEKNKTTSSVIELPVENGRIKYYYGKQQGGRDMPMNTNTFDNPGITIESKQGSRVKTTQEGQVISVFDLKDYKAVIIRKGNTYFTYSGLKNVNVIKNQILKKNEIIGKLAANSSGESLLDFIVMNGTKNIDSIEYLRRN